MGKIIFIVGGVRSGKSAFALKRAKIIEGRRLYIATAQPLDGEMEERINKHRKERGDDWDTVEEPISIVEVIKKSKNYGVVLLDCLTLWISNLMHKKLRLEEDGPATPGFKEELGKVVKDLLSTCKDSDASIIIVSNEVGLGIVPDNPLARRFCDIAGYVNQRVAEAADEVFFMVSGIPMKVK